MQSSARRVWWSIGTLNFATQFHRHAGTLHRWRVHEATPMTSSTAARNVRIATIVVLLALAGCAGRSLNAPPVVDWSNGAQPASAATAAIDKPVLYTVKREDTLASIATRFNTTPANLASWNNLGPDARVRPDQVLRVSPPSLPSPPVVQPPVATTQPIGSEGVEQRQLGAGSGPAPMTVPSSTAPIKSGPLGIKRPYSDAALAELSRPDGDSATVPSQPTAAPSVLTATPSAPAPAASIVWSWPVSGKPANSFGDGKTKGIDIPGKAGDAILAAADGKVTFSSTGVRGYGNFVIVQHSSDLLSVYAHNRVNLVKEGAVVTRGQKIAEMGNSDSDAVKLHFEIRHDSKPVDPLKYLPER
jgi:lipoprotein NlpD